MSIPWVYSTDVWITHGCFESWPVNRPHGSPMDFPWESWATHELPMSCMGLWFAHGVYSTAHGFTVLPMNIFISPLNMALAHETPMGRP